VGTQTALVFLILRDKMAEDTGILSVGIDIGTSTTQVVFSRLVMENTASYFAVPSVSITDKQVVYKSDIYLTPLKTPSLIDGDAVRGIVAEEFSKAGYAPADTKTGAVIITGESARKENAAIVLEKLSDFAGDFVVSTAGPDLEAIVAGKGSGAQQYSKDYHCTAVNLDIGGGTTNIALFDCGDVIAKGCLDIGGRLIRIDAEGVISYVSPSAALVAEWKGVDIKAGVRADLAVLGRVCEGMAQLLEQELGLAPKDPLLLQIQTPGSTAFHIPKPISAILFSGGVADCIYKTSGDLLAYGDIGVILGKAIREGSLFGEFRMIEPKETIRATVVGAGMYTTSLSGSTIAYTGDCFPLKNIPVLRLGDTEEEECFAGRWETASKRVQWLIRQSGSQTIVIAMKGRSNPTYASVKTLAAAFSALAAECLNPGAPLLLVMECDMAKALGQAMVGLLQKKYDVVALDSIRAEDGDYMDLGKPLMDGLVIPVVVKTLIFG
jgi:ethanolamine utilization protein EutA